MTTWEIIAALKKNRVVPRLAGGQLKLVGETRSLPQDLLELVKDRKEELRAFLREAMDQQAFAPIPAIAQQEHYAASNAQKRIWVLSQLEGGSAAYNIVRSFYLKGSVVKEHLERAFQLAVQRHESLRTVFKEISGELRQVVLDNLPFEIEYKDSITREQLMAEVEQAACMKFDLSHGPLLSVKLYQLSAQEYAMIFNIHHIISDGWSIGVLVPEVMRAYRELCEGRQPLMAPLGVQYKDYCEWHERRLEGERSEQAKDFWLSQFAEMPDALELPADAPRPATRSFEGAVTRFYPGRELFGSIQSFCKEHHNTAFNFFRATLSLLLARVSGQQDIVIGSPASGRNHSDLEDQVGLYINTLPLRAQVNAEETFDQFLKQVTEHSFKAFQFQDYPFDNIIEDLAVRRDTSRNPLFDVMLVVQDAAIGEGSVNKHQQYGFELNLLNRYLGVQHDEKVAAKFDLTFNLDYEPDNTFYIEIEYDSRLFTKERISRIFGSYMHVIEQVMRRPGKLIREIEIIEPVEKKKILHWFNLPVREIQEQSILELLDFNRDKTAIITNDAKTSYRELDKASDQIAGYLQGRRLVGLMVSRSEKTIAAILGILKAGAAYVPVDITYPASRIEYIIQDAKLDIILTDDEGMKVAPAGFTGQFVHVDEAKGEVKKPIIHAEQTAYIIYTSGSTGNPKGVEICHRNTIAFLKWCHREFAQTPYEILYATTSYCFDLSVFEFLFPLMQGKTIRMLPSAMEITEWIGHDERIMINTVPSVVRNLLGMDWSNVAVLNVAGEPVPQNFKTALDHSRMEVRNLYGPTEDTTYSTMYRFAEDGHASIPIGSSIDYSQLYILDAFGNLQPVGVYGEIYLGGQSVAKGYLNKPELTAERFLPNPFLPGTIMYKTGDIGRWLEDGLVEYAGRTDDQVKIRGHRIEPGEVQFRLEQHPLVKQAVVVVRKIEGEDAMVAYVSGDADAGWLKDHLATILPAYMVPAYWLVLDEIPLNSNGKVDKKRLPLPAAFASETVIVEPQTELQRKLFLIWKKLIPAASFGITDNFFDIGGHSLKAIKLRFLVQDELGMDITLNEIFAHPTIEKQANLLESRPLAVAAPIEVVAAQEAYPISLAQERLWVLTKFREASLAYNMPAVYKVHGKIDVNKLQEAFRLVIQRYEILRTVFTDKGGMPVQRVLPAIDFEIQTTVAEDPHFDLEKGPLLRCALVQCNNEWFLHFNMHHMISDGWSLGILFQNISKAYQLAPLPPLPIQYKDYATWQRQQPVTEHLDYWLEQFKEEVQPLELPTDFNRPEVKTYNGDACQFLFKNNVHELSRLAGASDFMTLMAAVRVLLKKYTGQQDIVIGTPVSGRNHPQLQEQVGFYVNSLPIRVSVNSDESFLSLLQREKETMLAALSHQELSFEMLVEELQLKRDLSRSPLFDVMLVLEPEEPVSEFAPGIQLERINAATGVSKYDLLFSFAQREDGLLLTVEFNTDLFLASTIERMMKHFGRVVEQVTASPQILIKNIVLPDAEECAVLASKADQTNFAFDENATIVSLFSKAVNPAKTALVFGDKHLTYGELDTKSGQLASILLNNYHVQPQELIALHFRRNEWMIIAILGVLKAGAAYVPIDPDYPAARTNYILADSGCRLILSDTKDFIDITQLDYTGPTAIANVKPSDLAYVIYTSGTTGNPKGVLIEHRQVTRLLFHEGNLYDFNENDVWSLFHSYCFDFSVWEMYGALLYGGTLVIVPKHIAQDGRAFYDFMVQHRITVLNQTPTAFRSMLQASKITEVPVRYLIFGGEALMPAVLAPWKEAVPQCRIINMYGITETTVHVTFKEITDKEISANQSNIGLPMPTVSCFVLDTDLQQVPIGVTGELCVGGQGVARGYLNRPELTAAKFIDHPFKPGERMYRSGDFARILSNGDIEYIGRRDDQVKIRGHRIEPAEVEAALIHQPGIKDAVVLTLRNAAGEYELAAYFIPGEDFDSTAQLRKSLNELLPSYMVPSYLVSLTEFPVNSNGKLDKTALPAPREVIKEQTTYTSSRNETDRAIMAIWEAVLERKNIGIKDNFFDLGGHSLKATRVVSRIHETMGVKIDLKALFMEPTIENLSNYVETVRWMEHKDEVLAEGQDEIIF